MSALLRSALIVLVVLSCTGASDVYEHRRVEGADLVVSIRSSAGDLVADGGYRSQKRHGEWHYWFRSGSPLAMGSFLDDAPDGLWFVWDVNGSISSEMSGTVRCDGSSIVTLPPWEGLLSSIRVSPDALRKLESDGIFPFQGSNDWWGAGLYRKGEFIRELNELDLQSAERAYRALAAEH